MLKSKNLPIYIVVLTIALFLIVGGGITLVVLGRIGQYQAEKFAAGYEKYESCEALANRLNKAAGNNGGATSGTGGFIDLPNPAVLRGVEDTAVNEISLQADGAEQGNADFSETNIQVEGVDEADIIKTDGEYIYLVLNEQLRVIKADNGSLTEVGNIAFKGQVRELFLAGDKLVINVNEYRNFAGDANPSSPEGWENEPTIGIAPDFIGGDQQATAVYIYEASNPESLNFERKVIVEGGYNTSRLTKDTVYLATDFYSRIYGREIDASNAQNFIPQYSDSSEASALDDFGPVADCGDIATTSNQPTSSFVTLTAIPLAGGDIDIELLNSSLQTLYASTENIYFVTYDYGTIEPVTLECDLLDNVFFSSRCIAPTPVVESQQSLNLFKVAITPGSLEYKDMTNIPGRLLNQFSLDERDGYLRIATTEEAVWDERKPSQSVLHVLNSDLEQVGMVEGLGEGEEIYAVRFIGDRAYVVTFRQIDPFYVIDLSDQENPKLLGELKIPGFSNYLHPYDANHIIGIGKEVDATDSRAIAEGVKLGIFDVTNPTNPVELHKTEIGYRGSNSEALNNHKAFLFDKDRELLVIPASLTEDKDNYWEDRFDGFVAFDITLEDGFEERGRIDFATKEYSSYYVYGGSRAIYIGDVLYFYKNGKLVSAGIESLEVIEELRLANG